MFLQWLDNLMNGLMSKSGLETFLVSGPLRRVAEDFPRSVFYAFRVAVTAVVNQAAVSSAKSGSSWGTSGTCIDRLLTIRDSHRSLEGQIIAE